MKQKRIKGKAFFQWLFSFFIILILPMLIGIFFYVQSVRTIQQEVERVNTASLEQVKTLLDGKLSEIKKICASLAMDDKTQSLAFVTEQLGPEDYYTKYQIQKDFGNFILSNGFIEDICLVLPQIKTVVTRNMLIENAEYSPLTFDDAFWHDLKSLNIPDLRISEAAAENEESSKRIIYYYPVAFQGSINTPEAWLVVIVNPVILRQLINNNDLLQQGQVLMIDQNDSMFNFGNSEATVNIEGLDAIQSNRISYQKIDGEEQLVIKLASENVELQYISLLPTRYFLSSVQYIKNLVLIYLVICLLAGGILIFYMTQRVYNPIEHLIQLYLSKGSKSQGPGFEEFPFLESSIKDMLNEHNSIQEALNQQRPIIRQNLLTRILKGWMTNIPEIQVMSLQYGINLQADSFLVMLIDAEDFGQHVKAADDVEDVLNLLAFLVENILGEILPDNVKSNVCTIDGKVACLMAVQSLGNPDETAATTESAEKIAGQIIQFFGSRFAIQMSIAISDLCHSLTAVSRACTDVFDVIEYKNLTNQKQVVLHAGKLSGRPDEYKSSGAQADLERQFTDFFRQGDYNNAMAVLDTFLSSQLTSENVSLKRVKYRVFGLINAMLNLFEELKSVVDVDFFEKLAPTERLIAAENLTELQTEVRAIFTEIAEYSRSRTTDKLAGRVGAILLYIDRNYHDANLSVEAIAREFNMDVSYLHRVFKRATGTGVLDQIHKVRVEKSKALLAADLSIKDIAGKVGFYNSLAMIRVFKKLEGMTPGTYRENLKEDKGGEPRCLND